MARRVLYTGAMRTLIAIVLLAASATAGSAGTYVGLGIGTGATITDSSGISYLSDSRSGRLTLGMSFGRISIEGAYTGYGVIKGNAADGGQYDSRTVQAAAKLNYPLGDNFEVFGRGGLLRTWLNPAITTSNMSLTGDGYTLSAGFEYKLNLGVAGGAIFVDYSHNQATLDDGTQHQVDQTASLWMLGVNLSI